MPQNTEQSARRATAEKLIAMGMSLEMISEATGLTLEELSGM